MLCFPPESLADWEKLSIVFQGFATGAAILVGSIWALFRFFSLREVEQVKLRLKKEQRELKEQPVVDLTMQADQASLDENYGLYVSITVFAKNNGTQVARLAYEGEPSLRVFLIEHASDGKPTFHKQRALHVRSAFDPNEFAKATIVRSSSDCQPRVGTSWLFGQFCPRKTARYSLRRECHSIELSAGRLKNLFGLVERTCICIKAVTFPEGRGVERRRSVAPLYGLPNYSSRKTGARRGYGSPAVSSASV